VSVRLYFFHSLVTAKDIKEVSELVAIYLQLINFLNLTILSAIRVSHFVVKR